MTKYRLIALDKRKLGGPGNNRVCPESFIVECEGSLDVFMNKWEQNNPYFKALHMTTYLDKHKYRKTQIGNHW